MRKAVSPERNVEDPPRSVLDVFLQELQEVGHVRATRARALVLVVARRCLESWVLDVGEAVRRTVRANGRGLFDVLRIYVPNE